MQQLTRVLVMFILTVGMSVSASTVWDPTANGITPPASGNWNDAANWTNGLPVASGDGSFGNDSKAVFNVDGSAECLVDAAATCNQLVVGDNATTNGHLLRIVNGGSLVAVQANNNWSAVGYNRSATMIVESGGYFETGYRLGVGWFDAPAPTVSTSYLTVDGGHVVVGGGGTLQIGNNTGLNHGGIVTVDHGGLLECANVTIENTAVSRVDVRYGTIIIDGDKRANIAAWQAMVPPVITAFGGSGLLAYDYNVTHAGKTTITASAGDPPTPNPATFDVVPVAISSSEITMTATPGYDVDGTVEYLFAESGGTDSGWITSNTYTATGLAANTTYTFTVTMRDSFGTQGAASDPESAATWSATTTTITWNKFTTPGDWGAASCWTPYYASSPDGNFKCVFNKSGAAEAVVTGYHIFSQLVQGSGGPGGVIRIVDGGTLKSTSSWFAIGHNNTARFIVEEGGAADFAGHAWLGMNNGADALIEINGGTFSVGGNFGMGYHDGIPTSGVANVSINRGSFNLDHWYGTASFQNSSGIDIEKGILTIKGDQTGTVADLVAADKITAYGGSGRVIYDYNIFNPGKTTVRAIEGVDGDVNKDGGVNMQDLIVFVDDWLDSDCDSPANFDAWCLVDFRDFTSLAANWLSGVATDWHVVSTLYPTDDFIVTPYRAENFGIAADGVTDVTEAIQDALILIDNLGGGALFLPAGHYKVRGNLTVPSRVTLRGDWQQPQPGSPVVGTILQAYAGRGDENAAPFIELSGSAGLNGITIWYPEQLPTDIQPYPPTIHGGGVTLENVTLVNSYFGFTTYREGTTARPFVRNVYGTPLKTGIEFDCLADIGRIESVHFSPDYWAGCGLANAPTAGQHEGWIYNNGTGMIVRRIDWSYSCYVTVEGYSIGFALRPSRYDGKYPNGQSYGFNLLGCKTGVYIEASAYAGYQFTRFNIQDAQTGVYLGTASTEADMFHTCTINAFGDAIFSEGTAKVMMMSCDIQQGALDIDGGYLSVINSNFASTAGNHIELASGVRGATIQGNTFAGAAQIVDNTSYPVEIDHTPLAVDALPAYDYKKPTTVYKPARPDLFVVTEAPYGAAADGVTDDTGAFQAALADAGVNGGGIVFVPGGNYRLNGTLIVPVGVELRGVFDVPHGTSEKGSLLNIYAGRNNAGGTPFIQLQSGAGIRGLNFHYPEQIYDVNDGDPVTGMYGMVPYPYLIRGLGDNIYVINIAATIPYQLLDLATYRCDRHYIDYIYSTALKTGIHVGNGSTDGQIHNCQFNPSAYTHQGNYYDSIPLGTSDNIHKILWRDATPYLFGNMTGQVLHENFVFGGWRGFHLAQESGFGPSGHCMGFGVDACTTAFHVDDVGSGGLAPINSQIVSTNGTEGHYLETGVSLTGTFKMFSSAGWGTHQYSAVLSGGDVRLQLFHLARDGESGAFQVLNNARVQNLGGNLRDYLELGRPFLTTDASATAEFVGNVINTPASQMPSNTANVTSRGNLRVQ